MAHVVSEDELQELEIGVREHGHVISPLFPPPLSRFIPGFVPPIRVTRNNRDQLIIIEINESDPQTRTHGIRGDP
jgi:hypothetical protein